MMTLGQHLREKREEKEIGLREMARRVKVTPSYLSKVERGEEKAGESLLFALAKQLSEESDTLLLMAGRIPPDVRQSILSKPELLEMIRRSVA